MAKQAVTHAGPAELLATQQAAVADALGTSIGPDGKLETPPQVAVFYAGYQQMQAVVSTLQEQVVGYGATIAQQASQIDQLTSLLGNKANASTVSTLSQRVTTLGTTVDSKASTAYVDQQVHAIGDVDASQAAAISQMKQELTGDGSQLTALLSNQASQKLLLDALRTDVDLKAPGATVSTLSGRVTSLASTVNDASTGLATKASAADFAPVASAVNNASTGLGATYTLAGAAKVAADAASTAASSAKTAADATTAGLVTANTAIGNRLRKDQPDTTAFPLGVPVASAMGNAVQKSELLGGIQQPYRYFLDVGATPAGAFMRSGAPAAISDALGLGQVLGITAITIKNTGTTTVATTVSLLGKDTAGNVVLNYQVPILVTAVPAVGKTADLLSLAPSLPADVPLTTPVTFTATATNGAKFEIRLDGKLK